MSVAGAKRQPEPAPESDERLVAECRKGDAQAWAALVDKYKNLVFSIPIKLGLYEEANDIFQAVWLDLLSDLPKLREARALPKWLMQTCYHKCLHHRRAAEKQVQLEDEHAEQACFHPDSPLPEELLAQLEREQAVREAITCLSPRCQQMVQMLFFEVPARPYQEIAAELGLASGSIGFIRGRCLAKLKKELEKRGL